MPRRRSSSVSRPKQERSEVVAVTEERKAQMRAYYARNRERVRAQQNARRDERGDNAERCRDYYTRNAEARRAHQREWNAANPEKVRTLNAAKKARRREVPLTPLGEEYAEIVRHDPCGLCGGPGGTLEHIVAVVGGGDSDWENLAGACLRCNTSKKATPLLLWMAR
jgi:hypothetical protein